MNSKQSQVALPHFKLIPIPNDKTKRRLSGLYLPGKEKKKIPISKYKKNLIDFPDLSR